MSRVNGCTDKRGGGEGLNRLFIQFVGESLSENAAFEQRPDNYVKEGVIENLR